MITLTLPTGELGWLALYPPEMGAGVTMRVGQKLYIDRGATGREARRSSDPTLSVALDLQFELGGADVSAMRDALKAYQAEPIVVPCWPLVVAGVDYSYGTTPQGGYMIAWNESGSYQFFTGAVTSPTSWDWIAPALYGYFDGLPKASASQPDFVRFSCKFVGDSPSTWALGPMNAAANASGPATGGFTPPGFPFPLDWAQMPESGAATVSITRDQVGPGRRKLTTFYPNTAERIVKGVVTDATPWALVCWWDARDGGSSSQWCTTGLSAGLLAADAAAGASSIQLSNQSGVVAGAVLAFDVTGPTGTQSIFYIKVASVAGPTVNLASTLPVICYTNLTNVSLAMLGRHIAEEMEIEWIGPGNIHAKLDWVELSQEYNPAGSETLGTTLGRKSGRAFLVELSSEQPVAEVLLRCTDWSTGITSGSVYQYLPLEVGERKRSVDLSDQSLSLTMPWTVGSPLAHFIPGQAFRRIFAKLLSVSVAPDGTVGTPVQEWYGEVVNVAYAGPKMNVTVSGQFKIFERQVPGDQYCTTCNAHLFDSRCGVDKASWTVSATVVGSAGNVVGVGSASRPGGSMAPLQPDNALAFGALQWVDAGGVTRNVGVYASSYLAGTYSLTLRETITIPNGTAVTVIPGCDLQWLGGCLRYTGNFRGFPFVPARAPQFTIPTSAAASGKK